MKLSSPHEVAADEWGRWFDFNDSSVTPMTVASLERAFSGTECGYMLMYRSRGLNSTARGDGRPVEVPDRWKAKITEANDQLARQRDEYELRSHQLEVTFRRYGMRFRCLLLDVHSSCSCFPTRLQPLRFHCQRIRAIAAGLRSRHVHRENDC
jgi:hypothetical protein